jgi:hypothetical protein
VALRFLKGTNLEKRLKGLNDISNMVSRIVKKQRAAQNKHRYQRLPAAEEKDDVDEPGFMDVPLMCQWIRENKVLSIILGEGAHIEIVKRCANILKFLARNSSSDFNADTVELIWKC